MRFREGTLDAYIWDSVVDYNEYKLPESINGVVVDIGAHIGSFSYACYERGAPVILAFEPLRSNFEVLQENLKDTHVQMFNTAVWRSDRYTDVLYHTGESVMPDGSLNTGGGNIL